MTTRSRPRSIRAAARPTIGKKPRKKQEASEHTEQVKVIDWARANRLRHPELKWIFAIPNGARLSGRTINGHRVSTEAIRLKAEGLLPGVSDLFLPAARGGFHGLFVEMKWGDNTPSTDQDRFLQAMTAQGYDVEVCWSAAAAIERIANYLAQNQ